MAYRRSPLMQERLADNRGRILKAARQLIAKGGLREASIAAVADTVGLSTGAIYRYFPSKSELFVELLTTSVNREVLLLRSIVAKPGTATEHLRAAVETYSARALQGPHLAYAYVFEPADQEMEAARLVCRRQFSAVFEEILRDGIKRGEFPAQSPEVSAGGIVGAFTEALVRPVTPHAKTVDTRKLVKTIVEFCVRAAGGQWVAEQIKAKPGRSAAVGTKRKVSKA